MGFYKFRAWSLCYLLGALAMPCMATAQCDTLVYATNPSYPPYGWSEDHHSYRGASIDLLPLLVPAGVKLQAVVYPWKRAQQMAQEGRIDLLLSLRKTPEREAYLLFSHHPIFANPIAIFRLRDKQESMDDWQALVGLRGGVSRGDTFGSKFDLFLQQKLTVETAGSMDENFEKLRRGRIDYFVSGQYAGNYYLHEHGMDSEIMALKPPVTDESIHIGFSRRSPCQALEPYVSARLEELGRSGYIKRLLDGYLRDTVAPESL
ncbi:MAG: amino acid ABC transporter substrate-binding protein [Aeromonadaceae bacterium]|nr:amino acid ABC transporter substrate-binding protein [Aeromonadaceae bacterium]